MKRVWIPVIFALAAGCASTPQAPASTSAEAAASTALDPAGSYVLSTTVQGMAVDGQMRIDGSPGAWSGSIYTDVTGELPLSSIQVQGQELHVTAYTADGTLTARLIFSGDEFTGDWSLGAEAGSLRGRKVDS